MLSHLFLLFAGLSSFDFSIIHYCSFLRLTMYCLPIENWRRLNTKLFFRDCRYSVTAYLDTVLSCVDPLPLRNLETNANTSSLRKLQTFSEWDYKQSVSASPSMGARNQVARIWLSYRPDSLCSLPYSVPDSVPGIDSSPHSGT